MSGLFYVADKHFEMFFRSRTASREQLSEAFAESSPSLHQEINLDSLEAYLVNKFPDRKHFDPKYLSDLIGELTAAGFKHIDEVDSKIERASEAFAAYEKEHPPSGDGKFGDIGVVRSALSIASDLFREFRMKKGSLPNVDFKNYQRLLK